MNLKSNLSIRVEKIFRHPIKSISREEITQIKVESRKAIPFDRMWALVHEKSSFDELSNEFVFKLAYSNFQIDSLEDAQYYFSKLKSSTSKFAPASQYYYACIAYERGLYKSSLESFQTGVQYQIYHSFFLFFLGLIPFLDKKEKKYILILTLTGIFLFCLSIYLLATNSQTSIDFSFIGPITPIGGLILILAWSLLFFYILKKKNYDNNGS